MSAPTTPAPVDLAASPTSRPERGSESGSGLAALLRDGSRQEHQDAEGSAFVTALMDGHINEEGYATFLAQVAAIYAALEETGRALAGDTFADAVLDDALLRCPAIERDLEFWAARNGQSPDPTPAPATRAYVDRIDAAQEWGGLFVAHHYTRYMGDLSGGQAIGRVIGRTYGLDDGRGREFFAFPAIPKPKPYKDGYRARLDALPVDDAQRARMLAEVKVAFAMNGAIFAELNGELDRFRR